MDTRGTFHVRHRHRVLVALTLAAAAIPVFLSSVTPSGATAVLSQRAKQASSVHSLNERMSLKITSIKGNTIYARGPVSGSIPGNGSFNLTLKNASRASSVFSGGNSHGGVAGTGNGRYRVSGAVSYFSGSVNSFRGSGRYAHARSLGVSVSGTVNRQTFIVTMTLHGRWED